MHETALMSVRMKALISVHGSAGESGQGCACLLTMHSPCKALARQYVLKPFPTHISATICLSMAQVQHGAAAHRQQSRGMEMGKSPAFLSVAANTDFCHLQSGERSSLHSLLGSCNCSQQNQALCTHILQQQCCRFSGATKLICAGLAPGRWSQPSTLFGIFPCCHFLCLGSR